MQAGCTCAVLDVMNLCSCFDGRRDAVREVGLVVLLLTQRSLQRHPEVIPFNNIYRPLQLEAPQCMEWSAYMCSPWLRRELSLCGYTVGNANALVGVQVFSDEQIFVVDFHRDLQHPVRDVSSSRLRPEINGNSGDNECSELSDSDERPCQIAQILGVKLLLRDPHVDEDRSLVPCLFERFLLGLPAVANYSNRQ